MVLEVVLRTSDAWRNLVPLQHCGGMGFLHVSEELGDATSSTWLLQVSEGVGAT